MPGKHIHHDGVLGFVKSARDVLNEKTEGLLFLLCRHVLPIESGYSTESLDVVQLHR
jgi:hypothetical protein